MASFLWITNYILILCVIISNADKPGTIDMELDLQQTLKEEAKHDNKWTMWLFMRSWEMVLVGAVCSICCGVICCYRSKWNRSRQRDREPLLNPREDDTTDISDDTLRETDVTAGSNGEP